jgi:regulator of nonsense transcripts 1
MQVRWDLGLSGRRVAYFMFPKEESEVKMMAGDEMRLRLPGDSQRAAWEAMGHVVRLAATEEVGLELRSAKGAPVDVSQV